MIKRVMAAILLLLSVSGCDFFGPDPLAPSLPPVFGARVTDGQLRLWTGTPCGQVSRVIVNFSPGSERLILTPPAGEWASVEYLDVDGPYPDLDVIESLPRDFDWRGAEDIDLSVDSPHGAGSTQASIAEIVSGSAEHPDDTYYFQGIGWLNPAQVTEQNGKSLLTVCTDDPAKEPSLPAAFGARVTDGTLRVWTGTTCTGTNGVSLSFKPDDSAPAETTLKMHAPSGSPVDFDRLTVGEPPAGMQVQQPLPDGFDWRTMQSLTLRIHRPALNREATVELGEVIDGSPNHPDDSYYFEGIGWLDPAQVAEQDGKTFLGPCTPDPTK